MSFNGQGVFNPLYNWQQDAAQGLNIQADRMQGQDQDMANGLSNCITKDGQSTPTANLKMGGFKHTNASAGVADSDYATMAQLNAVSAAINLAIPVGMIAMWNSTASPIPSNFQLCDGTNGTPDLRGKFVIGADQNTTPTYANGATGGTATNTLSVANLPPHNHPVNDPGHLHGYTDPGHLHQLGGNVPLAVPGGSLNISGSPTSGAASQTLSATTNIQINTATTGITTSNTGSGTAVNNLPPYYALCFVQRMS
ncbi:hypothetical protein ACQUFY_11910 [Robbsia andropogonis]|uniref:hypothetical protein n=1 Tax=Robbsia andropogonis TaxID=28092 RepID=UPI003D260057